MNNNSTIFIVDDDELDREAIIWSLRKTDFHCIEFQSGEEGLAGLSQPHDIILLDHKLRDMDGLTFLDIISKERLTKAPVIMLTGSENPAIVKQALQLGAQDYLIKGHYTDDTLVRAINYSIERKKLEVMLTDAKDAAEAANRAKSAFLANMSHELRTPLNSLLILAELFVENRESNLTKEQQKSAEIMYQSGNELLTLINEILDLSKIEAHMMPVHVEEVLIKELLDSLVQQSHVLINDKPVTFDCQGTLSDSASIQSDGMRLIQILRNLISNAIKFTQRGKITLTIAEKFEHYTDIPEPCDSWVFAIEDTGIGISLEDQQEIFKAFAQADGSITRRYGGTGLGLSISSKLARLLGGKIELQSTLGKGSCFYLSLPKAWRLAVPNNSDVPTTKDSGYTDDPLNTFTVVNGQSPYQGKHAVIVDSDKHNLFSLDKVMTSIGFTTTLFQSSKGYLDYIATADQHTIDMILIDMMMSDITGIQAIEATRAMATFQHAFIVAVTGDTSKEKHNQYITAGASDLLIKPLNKASILSAMGRLAKVCE